MATVSMAERFAAIAEEDEVIAPVFDLHCLLAGTEAIYTGHHPPVLVRIARIRRDAARIYRADGKRFDTAEGARRRIWVSRAALQPTISRPGRT